MKGLVIDMYEDFFAERLTTLRESKNISAREMSLAIGQNGSYINRIENKQAFPSMQAFFYICEYLNITPYEFFNSNITNPCTVHDIVNKINQLTPQQLHIIDILINEFIYKNK